MLKELAPYVVIAVGIMLLPVAVLTVSVLATRGKVNPSDAFTGAYSRVGADVDELWKEYHRSNIVPASLFTVAVAVVAVSGVVWAAHGARFDHVVIVTTFCQFFVLITYGAWVHRQDKRFKERIDN